jgi:hypothetical protein
MQRRLASGGDPLETQFENEDRSFYGTLGLLPVDAAGGARHRPPAAHGSVRGAFAAAWPLIARCFRSRG